MKNGILYGISVGPGDPELMTLKAVKELNRIEVIVSPKTQSGEMLALSIAQGAVDLTGKEILAPDFPMTRDADLLRDSHEKAAKFIEEYLSEGRDVAMLNLGDASVYGTFGYVSDIVLRDGYEICIVPGVTSFCAAAAAGQVRLTEMDKPVRIYPGNISKEELLTDGSKIIMKSGKGYRSVMETIADAGLLEKTVVVKNCGLQDEEIIRNPGVDLTPGYFTVILIEP